MNIGHRHDLERVGLRVAAEQDRMLAGQALPDSDLLLEGIGRRQRRAQGARRRALGVAGGALVLLLGVLFAFRAGLSAPVASRGVAAPPALPAPPPLGVTKAAASSVPLQFVDGTRVVVKAGAVADVREVRDHGATIALESGTLDVHVVHTESSRWDVVAGQFDVRVTGTRFDATWDPRVKQLTVAMTEGTVHVSGPCVDESLSAPNTKVFVCSDPVPPSAAASLATTAPLATPATAAGAKGTPPKATMGPSEDDALARESAAVLLGLADSARLAGEGARARSIYTRVRQRFPHTDDAAKAAFLLGRMAEVNGAADDAVRLYETAIGESPNGAFSQDALGRTIELEQRRGNTARARMLAAEYLSKHPNGPYRAYSASVLDADR